MEEQLEPQETNDKNRIIPVNIEEQMRLHWLFNVGNRRPLHDVRMD